MYFTNIFHNLRKQTVQIENDKYVIRKYNGKIWVVQEANQSLLKHVPLVDRISDKIPGVATNEKEKALLKKIRERGMIDIPTKELLIQKTRHSNSSDQLSSKSFQEIGRYEIPKTELTRLIQEVAAWKKDQTQKGMESKRYNEKPLYRKKDKNLLNDSDLREKSIEERVKDTQQQVKNIKKMSKVIQELNQTFLLRRIKDIEEHSNRIEELIIFIQRPGKDTKQQYITQLNDLIQTQFKQTLCLSQDTRHLNQAIDKLNINVQKLSKNIRNENIEKLSINVQEQIQDIQELIINVENQDIEELIINVENQDIEKRITNIQDIQKEIKQIYKLGKNIRDEGIKELIKNIRDADVRDEGVEELIKDIEKLSINVENQNTTSDLKATEKPEPLKTINKKDFVGVVHNEMLIVADKKNTTHLKDFINLLKKNEHEAFKMIPYHEKIAIIPTKKLYETNCAQFSLKHSTVSITKPKYRTVEVQGIEESISVINLVTEDGLMAAQQKLIYKK